MFIILLNLRLFRPACPNPRQKYSQIPSPPIWSKTLALDPTARTWLSKGTSSPTNHTTRMSQKVLRLIPPIPRWAISPYYDLRHCIRKLNFVWREILPVLFFVLVFVHYGFQNTRYLWTVDDIWFLVISLIFHSLKSVVWFLKLWEDRSEKKLKRKKLTVGIMVGRMYRSGWKVDLMELYHVYSHDMYGGTPDIERQNRYDHSGDHLFRNHYVPPYLYILRTMDHRIAHLTFGFYCWANLIFAYKRHSFVLLSLSDPIVCAAVCIFWVETRALQQYLSWLTGISHVNILLRRFTVIVFIDTPFALVILFILSEFYSK